LPIKERVFTALMYIAKYGTQDITHEDWSRRILRQKLGPIADSIQRASSLYAAGGPRIFAIGALEVINKGVRHGSRIELSEAKDEN
jgi:hypothetical protein